MLSHPDLLQLKCWNTPTIYNGWEQLMRLDPAADGFNLEENRDFMPQMGPMVGYAVTVVIEPSNKAHREVNADAGANIGVMSLAFPERGSSACAKLARIGNRALGEQIGVAPYRTSSASTCARRKSRVAS